MSGRCGSHPAGIAGRPGSRIHRLDPRAKVLGLVGVTVVAVSAPVRLWPVWLACAVALGLVASVAGVGPRLVWRRSRAVLPLVLLVAVLVPFLRHGGTAWSLGPLTVSREGLGVLAGVAAKATLGTISAVLLGATTSFPDVLRALEALRVPRLVTLIAGFTYRYLFVIADEVRRMRAALQARGYRPRHALQAAAVGRVATALFLRSYGRGERVYLAMVARGYAGTMPQLRTLAFGRADALFLGGLAAALLAVRVGLEVAA